jgi:hypothetical protein
VGSSAASERPPIPTPCCEIATPAVLRIRIFSNDHAPQDPAPLLSESTLSYVAASNDWRGDIQFGTDACHVTIWYVETGNPSNPCTWERRFDAPCLAPGVQGIFFDSTRCDPFLLTVSIPANGVSPCGYATENGITVWIDDGND